MINKMINKLTILDFLQTIRRFSRIFYFAGNVVIENLILQI